MQLFRFMCREEQVATQALGFLHPGKNSCEGKHFAITLEDARRWGEMLAKSAGVIVEVTVDDQHFKKFYHVGANVDGIGDAYFANEDQLIDCKIERYHE